MGEAHGDEHSQRSSTVERAADVLLYFASRNAATLGVTEIAAALGMSKAGVHRILSALRSRGLVSIDEDRHRYSLGPMSMTLGLTYLARLDVRRLAAAELRELCTQTGETATLSVRTGSTRVYIDQVTPRREVVMSVSVGVPFPLHAGASSKAFLAFLPPDQIAAYLGTELAALTADTVTEPVRLRHELDEIRRRGWAQTRGERQPGAASVAAPVCDQEGRPAAVVSVCGPATRFEANAAGIVRLLLAVTDRLSVRLGASMGRA